MAGDVPLVRVFAGMVTAVCRALRTLRVQKDSSVFVTTWAASALRT
jgi:hypothetical protein